MQNYDLSFSYVELTVLENALRNEVARLTQVGGESIYEEAILEKISNKLNEISVLWSEA